MASLRRRHASVGIDFGTTRTVAAVRHEDGRVDRLRFDGSPQLPSGVFLGADGQPFAGADAVRSGLRRPDRFVPHPKRRIDDDTMSLGGRELPVSDAIAAVLSRVRREIDRTRGSAGPVTITVPATWGPTRKQVIVDAAATAGFRSVALVPEPVATATCFVGDFPERAPVGSALLVCDLGGGSFDATLLKRTRSGFEILACDSAEDLGGLDLDQALFAHLARTVQPDDERWQRLIKPAEEADVRSQALLLEELRRAKERLSRHSFQDFTIPLLDVEVRLTRRELEGVARPLIERTVHITQEVIRKARLAPEEITGLVTVGAASRMPLVATVLEEHLALTPVVVERPDLVVARGGLATPAVFSPPPKPKPRSAGKRTRRSVLLAGAAVASAMIGLLAVLNDSGEIEDDVCLRPLKGEASDIEAVDSDNVEVINCAFANGLDDFRVLYKADHPADCRSLTVLTVVEDSPDSHYCLGVIGTGGELDTVSPSE